ncbi:hypothetical protein 2019_scaffold132_00003 [Bacteriophage sp.]|nr:hypothetical protein 2019_scaffold132_00003 [Bacteriophage sp.]
MSLSWSRSSVSPPPFPEEFLSASYQRPCPPHPQSVLSIRMTLFHQ